MKKKIVIMQPHFIPWFGYFELIKVSDIFVFLDDVTFPRSSYVNRVNIYETGDRKWLTFPLQRNFDTLINNAILFNKKNEFETLKKRIHHSLSKNEYYSIVKGFFDHLPINNIDTISEFNIYLIKKISNFLFKEKYFFLSSELKIKEKSSKKIFEICKHFNATHYITGHGSKNYLDYEYFEKNKIEIKYMDYKLRKYQNLNYFYDNLLILDLISYNGKKSVDYMNSKEIDWKFFLKS